MELKEKVALITGGAAGIGLAITIEFLKNNVKGVLVVDCNTTRGEEICSKLGANFGRKRIHFCKGDITDDDEFEGAFKKALEIFGRLDIVVNNAGILRESQYKKLIDVNLTGTLKGILLGLQFMGKKKNDQGGAIINIASIAAIENDACFMPLYGATKMAVLKLTQAYGHKSYYARTGVRIMAICPGGTRTEILHQLEIPVGWEEQLNSFIIQHHNMQNPDVIGRGAVHILEKGDTGSVWTIEDSKLNELNIPNRDSYTVFVKDLASESRLNNYFNKNCSL